MEQAEFWQIISASRKSAGHAQAQQVNALSEILRALPPAQIAGFNNQFIDHLDQTYHWDLWGAAYIIGEGCSEEDFIDFRAWLISMGRDVYQAALANADSLAPYLDDDEIEDFFFEEIQYVASDVYQSLQGEPLPFVEHEFSSEPAGEEWDPDSDVLRTRLPKLWQKFHQ